MQLFISFMVGRRLLPSFSGLLVILIIFGILNGKQIQADVLPKKYAMMVHIPIFLVGAGMIYLATIKPF